MSWFPVNSIVHLRVTRRWMGISSHQFGMRVSRMRPYTTPPYMFFDPGNGPRSSRQTDRPARASSSAAADPAGPAPTTIASKSAKSGLQFVEHRVGVAHDREVRHRHHRTVRIGVDADDV